MNKRNEKPSFRKHLRNGQVMHEGSAGSPAVGPMLYIFNISFSTGVFSR